MPTTSIASAPPSSASALYQRLYATSIEFIASMDKDDTLPSLFNIPRVRAVRTSDFVQSWGHNYNVSQKSRYAKPMDVEGLIEHMVAAIPILEKWDVTITDVMVDVELKRTVVRSSHWMQAKAKDGAEAKETVEDDIVWLLEMDGEGQRVKKAIEFKDVAADERLVETIKAD